MNDSRHLLSDHPSVFALDRAALGDASEAMSGHLAACERCRARIEELADPAPLPAALERRLRREVGGTRPARRPWERLVWGGGLVAAAAALLLLVLVDRGPGDEARVADGRAPAATAGAPADPTAAYDTTKGGRAVAVHVRRGQRTFLWDGREPVRPGDRLRLELVPDGLRFVHVFGEVGGGGGDASLVPLHQEEVAPTGDTPLGAAWQVDGGSRREVLIVVLSRAALTVDAARAAARSPRTDGDTWVTRLVLPVAIEPAAETRP